MGGNESGKSTTRSASRSSRDGRIPRMGPHAERRSGNGLDPLSKIPDELVFLRKDGDRFLARPVGIERIGKDTHGPAPARRKPDPTFQFPQRAHSRSPFSVHALLLNLPRLDPPFHEAYHQLSS